MALKKKVQMYFCDCKISEIKEPVGKIMRIKFRKGWSRRMICEGIVSTKNQKHFAFDGIKAIGSGTRVVMVSRVAV